MDWKKWLLNLVVMGVVYAIGYSSSYFLSKRYAIKKKEREDNEKQK